MFTFVCLKTTCQLCTALLCNISYDILLLPGPTSVQRCTIVGCVLHLEGFVAAPTHLSAYQSQSRPKQGTVRLIYPRSSLHMCGGMLGPPKAWTIHRYYTTVTVISHRNACLLPQTLNTGIQTCYLHQVALSLARPLCYIFMVYDCITAKILLNPSTDSIWWSNSTFCGS